MFGISCQIIICIRMKRRGGRTEVNRFTPETQTSCVTRFMNRTTYIGLTAMPSIEILSRIEAGIGSCERSTFGVLRTSSRESTFSPRLTSEIRKRKTGRARACCSRKLVKAFSSYEVRMVTEKGNAPYRTLLPSNATHTACTSSPVRHPTLQRGRVTLPRAQCRLHTFVHQRLDLGLSLLKRAEPVLRASRLLPPGKRAGQRSGR